MVANVMQNVLRKQDGPLLHDLGNRWGATPTGEARVQTSPTQRFNETWDSGTIDSINKWVATSGGGGVAPSASVGAATLNSGTTANGFAKLTTIQSFRPPEPGFYFVNDRINLQSPLPSSGYLFFGSGTSPASPTIASSMNQGMGWELTKGGVFTPVVYQTGTRVIPTLTGGFQQPSDTAAHKYYRWFRGDIGYWCIDDPDNIVAYYLTGASGPDINTLPLLYQVISNGSPAVTMQINGIGVGDTADTSGNILLDNGFTSDVMRPNTDANSSLTVLSAQGTGTVNSTDQLNVNGRGIIVVINITAITAGSLTVTIQGKDIVSGVYYTLLASAALAATGTTVLTVYPGMTASANAAANSPLPRTWRISSVVATGPVTATVGASVIL